MKILYLFLIVCFPLLAVSQDQNSNPNPYKISIASGIVMSSVIDKNISSQRYSGSLTPIIFSWGHNRQRYDWSLNMNYSYGSLWNNNVHASLDDFKLSWDYIYPIKEFEFISNRPTSWFGGFSPHLWMYYRKQEIAEPDQFLYSVKIAINMSLTTGLKGALSNKFEYIISTRFNMLSYALSSDINEGNTSTATKFSTIFTTPLLEAELALDYKLISWLKTGLGYQFKYYNHESLRLASDSFTINLSATF